MSKKCPICGRDAAESTLPFCSKRCKDIDLGRWFTGHYAVPGESTLSLEEEIPEESKE